MEWIETDDGFILLKQNNGHFIDDYKPVARFRLKITEEQYQNFLQGINLSYEFNYKIKYVN